MDLRSAGEVRGFAGRAILAAIAGASIALTVIYMLYQTVRRIYYDYYFYAQVKEHYIKTDTRQRALDAIFVPAMLLALFVAYRLLTYSLAGRPHSSSHR